ncbi:MAG TPA: ROK family glucokinase [Candidatus Choladousia intestinavium]|uniref:Glucokinase n=1 Tax=Candidatus Choladousia intestinavium TaxID=2840727 RepID=A0A9D1D8M7_9FIRM|nr:ROK family glucokinase [Candidatus Choladousia intestinavium]
MKRYCFGIDVGGTTVKCGFFTTEGQLLDKWEIPTRIQENGKYILPDVASAILKKMEEKKIQREEVAGVGIGVPGPVNDNGEVPVAVNLHWGHVCIEKDLEELTGLKVKAGNDANVAALGELWKGGASGRRSLIMVTLGTGVGGGIIVNEKVIAGAHGAGGEIGHVHVEDSITDPCNCGNCGCLEQVASATGIARLAREELEKSQEPSLLRGRHISAKAVFDAVKEGDALAVRVAERFGLYLGKALSIFASVADPQVIVIGGGVSKAGPILLDFIVKNFKKYAFSSCKETEFVLAELGNDAGIYGAAKLVL